MRVMSVELFLTKTHLNVNLGFDQISDKCSNVVNVFKIKNNQIIKSAFN